MAMAEGTEEKYLEATGAMLDGMVKIITDEKSTVDDKIKAAKIIHASNGTFAQMKIIETIAENNSETRDKLLDQVDKLTDKDNYGGER